MKKIYTLIVFSIIFLFSSNLIAQTNTATPEEDEFAKKKPETKIMEVIPTDSVGTAELVKRAAGWVKAEALKYRKTNGTTGNSQVECIASFPVKPKELNPMVDFTGKITMKVLVECKSNKYRYTISDIKHISKTGKSNGGSVDNVVPECGSMGMTDIVWKRLKGEAMKSAGTVASDLKAAMSKVEAEPVTEEW